MSRCTWALVDRELLQKLASTTEPKAKKWLFTLMELLSHAEFVKLSVTLWAIWAARRKAIHEGIFQSPHAIMSFVDRYIDELEVINGRQESVRIEPRMVHISGRKPKAPPMGYAKINVDAGCRKGSWGTAAAVCRDNTGTFLGSSALVIRGVDDPAMLETIACREGLALPADLHLNQFVIASDAKEVVSAIHNDSMGAYGAIIKEIRVQQSSLHCNFCFEGRLNNLEAHRLAKHSLSLGLGRHVWLGQPHDLNCIPLHVVFDE
ncbi:uncharacterized protein [Aegilops tauschii subsp. strangulata]|uniref:uncharacterized protein n=1 Tax=Aegilops tauschii subsp. strangulata TaxID=200361 RepID=UPI003CC8B69E